MPVVRRGHQPTETEAFPEPLPAEVGHFSARNRHDRTSKILRFELPTWGQ